MNGIDKKPQDIFETFKEIFRKISVLERVRTEVVAPSYSDATRPTAGTVGRVIFNTDDGKLNIDNGTNWTLPDGSVT